MLSSWQVVDSMIEQSKIKRYNWKSIFGITLTDLITQYKNKGWKAEDTIISINDYLCMKGFNDYKMFENVKISVYARYGEQNALNNRTIKR